MADRMDAAEVVPTSALRLGESPRLAGEDSEHTQRLAELDTVLPPILVHRTTMRIIDGVHRLRAAQLTGRHAIAVRFFDGTDEEAFVQAVRANVTHGLPLSLADRKAAAARILASYPYWSDRAIASATGLAGKTVGAIRRQAGEDTAQGDVRIGRDGRARPVSNLEGRRAAEDIIATRPDASLRAVARAAGISPATVRDVRERMRRGEPPAQPIRRDTGGGQQGEPRHRRVEAGRDRAPRSAAADREAVLRNLSKDPSLRFTDSGRALLRWLASRAVGPAGWPEVVRAIPPHCSYALADLARACADEWHQFAYELEQMMADEQAGDGTSRPATA